MRDVVERLLHHCLILVDEWSTRSTHAFARTFEPVSSVTVDALEPRVLFSAVPIDPAMMPTEQVETVEVEHSGEESAFTTDQPTTLVEQSPSELVIVDPAVEDIEQLLDDLDHTARNIEVFVLDAERDGIDQITEILDQRSDVSAIHLFSHGSAGELKLGNVWLADSNFEGYAGQIASWSNSLLEGADLLIYGCDLAGNQSGQQLVENLSQLTGADVAASVDDTGHASLGGDWDLEFSVGLVETLVAPSELTQAHWRQTFAIQTITDNFGVANYSNNDGSVAWSGSWIENDTSGGGFNTGNIKVDGLLGLKLKTWTSLENIYREADLSTAASATLTYDVNSGMSSGDAVRVEISSNGGGNWTTLIDYTSTVVTSESFDISAYASANTRLRFRSLSSGNDSIYFDNIKIEFDDVRAPGGVEADLNLWLRADAGTNTTVDGSALATWSDQSSTGNDAVTAGSDPTFRDNLTSNINFNPVVNFDNASSQHLSLNGALLPNASPERAYFIVARAGVSADPGSAFYHGNSATDPLNRGDYVGFTIDGTGYAIDSGDSDYGDAGAGSSLGIYTAEVAAGGAKTDDYQLRVNGSDVTEGFLSGSSQNVTTETNYAYVGAGNSTGIPANFWDGDIAEIIVFDLDISATERQKIESYLAVKYGLTLDQTTPANYLDSLGNVIWDATTNSSFNFDIAGIGRDAKSSLDQSQSRSQNADAVLSMSGAADQQNVEFLLWGNDDGALSETAVDNPAGIGQRLERTWRAAESGDVGATTIEFDLTGTTYSGSTASDFRLIVDTDTAFSTGATVYAASGFNVGTEVVTFTAIDLNDGEFFALGTQFNTAPVADAGGPYVINEGDSLLLDASASTDADLDTLTYTWDLDGDGQFDDAVGETPTVSWASLGAMSNPINDDGAGTVTVRADDGQGGVTTDSVALTVNNVAPILTASGSATVAVGQLYTLNLSVVDAGDDTVSGWTINWGDGSIDTVVGNPASVTHTYSQLGFTHNITVAATDEDGTWTSSDLIVGNYVNGSENVRLFDGVTGDYESSFDSSVGDLSGPYQTTVGPDGNYYVSGYYSHNIVRYDAAGNYLGEYVTPGLGTLTNPTNTAFGPDGNLYIASYGNNKVLKFDGTTMTTFASGPGLGGPTGLVWGPDGDLYVSGWSSNRISKLDGITGARTTIINSGLAGPEQMAFDGAGNLYIADSFNDRIRVWDGTTLSTYLTHASINQPTGLTFGPDGSMYISSNDLDQVVRYDGTTTEVFVTASSGGLNDPEHLAFTPAHQVTVGNTPPTITSPGSVNVQENTDVVTTVIATDPEALPQILSYSITGGADATKFSIDSVTGDLTFDSGRDFEVRTDADLNNVYEVQVTVDDGVGGSDFQNLFVTVTDVNDAPSISGAALLAVSEDAVNPPGATASALFGGSFTDQDSGAAFGGVVIVGNGANAVSEGSWQYSSNGGANWFDIGIVNDSGTGLAISAGSLIRFLPVADFNGAPANLDVRGLDDSYAGSYSTTVGVEVRQTVDTSTPSDGAAFSDPIVSLDTSITAQNDIPDIGGTSDSAINDKATVQPFSTVTIGDVDGDNVTTTVTLIGGDANGQFSAASLLASGFTKTGAGQYQLAATTAASAESAIRLLVFLPTENQVAPSSVVASRFIINLNDGTAAVADSSTDVTVTSLNDAPSISAATLATINENDFNPPGSSVSALFGGSYSDPDAGATFGGVVAVGNAANPVTEGSWQYSSDGGANWYNVGTVNDTGSGLAIDASSLLRFVPVAAFTGVPADLVVRGLDDTYAGSYSTTSGAEVRQTVNTSSPTASSSFGNPVVALDTSVNPGTNAMPVIGGTSDIAINDNQNGTPFSTVTIADADGDLLTTTIVVGGGDANGQFTAASLLASGFTKTGIGQYSHASASPAATQSAVRLLVFDPTENQVASGSTVLTTLSISVDDGSVVAVDGSTDVSVTSVNDAPLIASVVLGSVMEDTLNPPGASVAALVGGVFADSDFGATLSGIAVVSNGAPNSEGEWQYSSDGGASWADVGSVSESASLLIDSSSLLRFVPAKDFFGTPESLKYRGLDDTFAGAYSDSSGGETRQTLNTSAPAATSPFTSVAAEIGTSITGVNDDPTMSDKKRKTVEGKKVTANKLFGKASNDVDGDALTALLIGGPTNGTLVLAANGAFTYTPDDGFVGTDSFQWVAFDGSGTSNVATVTIVVNPGIVPISTPADSDSNPDGDSDAEPEPVSDSISDASETETGGEPAGGKDSKASAGGSGSNPSSAAATVSSRERTGKVQRSAEDDFVVADVETKQSLFSQFGVLKYVMAESGNNDSLKSRLSTIQDTLADTLNGIDYALITGAGAMWDELDDLRNSVNARIQGDVVMVGAVGAAASSFTVTYIAWAVRSGFFLSGIIAHMPAWQAVDPISIMQGLHGGRESETLEQLIERRKKEMARSPVV